MSVPRTLRIERQGGVVIITLNRPDEANSLDATMAAELAAAAAHCDGDPEVRAVLLTGSGRFFCAGGDVKAMAGLGAHTAAALKRLADDLHRAIATFQRMRAPLVVAVNGPAAGAGFSLAVTGDIVLASEAASFTMAYTAIGLSPDGSSSWFLPRLIGLRRTQALMLTNRKLDAAQALDWGLVTEVVAADALADTALRQAQALAAGAAESQAVVKRLLLDSFANGLETQMEIEGRHIAHCAATADGQEGIRAFCERRRPRFG